MDQKEKQIAELREYIRTVENNLKIAKETLLSLSGEAGNDFSVSGPESPSGKVVEGIFDGENMLDVEGKIYPVPANYASKSKLVEGDRLKLSIAEDGSFIFKQIGPVQRKKLIGTLGFKDNAYHVSSEGQVYNVLYASVTYYKAKEGDRVTVVIPADGSAKWASLDNVIHEEAPTGSGVKTISTGLVEDSFIDLEDDDKNNLGDKLPEDNQSL